MTRYVYTSELREARVLYNLGLFETFMLKHPTLYKLEIAVKPFLDVADVRRWRQRPGFTI